MPKFNYVALDARGQESTGVIEAANSNDAVGQLRQAGYFPTSVIEEGKGRRRQERQEKGRQGRATTAAAAPGEKGGIVLFQKKTVKSKMLMIFTRQLATLIDAGLPLLRGLTVLAKQETRSRPARRRSTRSRMRVQGGSTFSEAMAQHPLIFNKLYINMVKAGELGGVLELVLNRLAEFQEKAQKVKNKVVAAMAYPGHRAHHRHADHGRSCWRSSCRSSSRSFKDMLGGKPLPAITQFVISVSNLDEAMFIRRICWYTVGIVVLSSSATRCSRAARRGRPSWIR